MCQCVPVLMLDWLFLELSEFTSAEEFQLLSCFLSNFSGRLVNWSGSLQCWANTRASAKQDEVWDLGKKVVCPLPFRDDNVVTWGTSSHVASPCCAYTWESLKLYKGGGGNNIFFSIFFLSFFKTTWIISPAWSSMWSKSNCSSTTTGTRPLCHCIAYCNEFRSKHYTGPPVKPAVPQRAERQWLLCFSFTIRGIIIVL